MSRLGELADKPIELQLPRAGDALGPDGVIQTIPYTMYVRTPQCTLSKFIVPIENYQHLEEHDQDAQARLEPVQPACHWKQGTINLTTL